MADTERRHIDDLSIEELRELVKRAADYAEVIHIFDGTHQYFMETFRPFSLRSQNQVSQPPGPKKGPFLVV